MKAPLAAFLAVASLTTVTACSKSKSAQSPDLLYNRNWLTSMPRTQDDHLQVYRFVPEFNDSGVFQDRTLYKGTFELFNYKVSGDAIHFVLHQTHDEVAAPFTIERVDGPAPFDLKLTIEHDPRGIGTYFGIRAETDKTGAALETELAALKPSSRI